MVVPDIDELARKKSLESMRDTLDQCGISGEYLTKKLRAELEANTTKQFQSEGEVITAPPVIAWDVRQRARQDAHKLRGDYPVEKKQLTIDGAVPVVELTAEEELEKEAIKEVLKKRMSHRPQTQ